MNLIDAVLDNNFDTLRYLLRFGDINSKDHNENTLLMLAVNIGNLEMIRFLVLNSANLNLKNKDGNTALHLAVRKNNIAAVKILLRNKAIYEIKNNDLETPLMLALRLGRTFIYQIILEFNPILDNINKKGEGFLAYLIYANDLNLLKKYESNYNLKEVLDYNNNSLLHLSVYLMHNEITKFLLELGLLPNLQNKYLETPLFNAARRENYEGANQLMQYQALLSFKNKEGNSVFEIASSKFGEYLLNLSYDIRYSSYLVKYPLHVAVILNDRLKIEQYNTILNQNKKDDYNNLASFYAKYYNHPI